jgi:predicted flap endonuclease-1-like 5' DNA nuclease
MKLRYTNPMADEQDIQIPGVQVEPMQNGATYEVDDTLGVILGAMPFWEPTESSEATESDGTSESSELPVIPLEQIKGIGPQIARILKKAGIDTVEQIVTMSARDIDSHLNGELNYVTTNTIRGWQESAASLLKG